MKERKEKIIDKQYIKIWIMWLSVIVCFTIIVILEPSFTTRFVYHSMVAKWYVNAISLFMAYIGLIVSLSSNMGIMRGFWLDTHHHARSLKKM